MIITEETATFASYDEAHFILGEIEEVLARTGGYRLTRGEGDRPRYSIRRADEETLVIWINRVPDIRLPRNEHRADGCMMRCEVNRLVEMRKHFYAGDEDEEKKS